MFEQRFDWRRALILLIVFLAVALLPQLCKAQGIDKMPKALEPEKELVKLDTIAIDYSQIKNIFAKKSASGKSIRYYVVYNYGGSEDVTTTGKSVLDYIDICKEAGIKPKLALKLKDGNVISIIKQKKPMKL